jgi:hypothetical protein
MTLTMAGAACPETNAPTHRPIAQNGNTPRTPITYIRSPCMKLKGTCPRNFASTIISSEMMLAKIIAIAIRATR